MRTRMTGLALALLGLVSALAPAEARSGHHGGLGGRHGMRGAGMRGGNLASDPRHANDDYVKAAAEEEDKLLDSKIKSICRGC
jgi:hypothetical protein